jgi:lysine 2,3-aminomutase
MAVPAYVIDAPGGRGKIPLLPDYLQSLGEEVRLKNYLGENCVYQNARPALASPEVLAANDA